MITECYFWYQSGYTLLSLDVCASLTACLNEGWRFWKNAAASTGSFGFAAAAACRCCSSLCWASTSSWIAGGKAAKNSGFTSVTLGGAVSVDCCCALCRKRCSLQQEDQTDSATAPDNIKMAFPYPNTLTATVRRTFTVMHNEILCSRLAVQVT